MWILSQPHCYLLLYEAARATIKKYCRLGSLRNRRLLFHSSWGWKCKIKVSAGLVSPEASLLGLQMATFSLCLHMSVHTLGVASSSYIDTSLIG